MSEFNIFVPLNGLVATAIVGKAVWLVSKMDIDAITTTWDDGAVYFIILCKLKTAKEFARQMVGLLNLI